MTAGDARHKPRLPGKSGTSGHLTAMLFPRVTTADVLEFALRPGHGGPMLLLLEF